MKTKLFLGHVDHGRPLTEEDYFAADYEGGYHYELIDGKLYVSSFPEPIENLLENWLFRPLVRYSERRPDVINYVTNKVRIHLTGRTGPTIPQPDVAAYHNLPLHLPFDTLHWQDHNPVLVVEILGGEDAAKDLIRNVEPYFEVPSIKEYWVLDIRHDPRRPSLLVHRQYGRRWRIINHVAGETYSTKLLPGFALLIDPRR
jgi:Uma2 family endonuclease